MTRNICNKNVSFIVILLICLVLIIIYRLFLDATIKKENDPLLNSILPTKNVTGWSVTHFIFYFILGYLFYGIEEMVFFSIIGISFEVLEETLKNMNSMFGVDKEKWMSGAVSDIAANSLGLIFGNYIAYISNYNNTDLNIKN